MVKVFFVVFSEEDDVINVDEVHAPPHFGQDMSKARWKVDEAKRNPNGIRLYR